MPVKRRHNSRDQPTPQPVQTELLFVIQRSEPTWELLFAPRPAHHLYSLPMHHVLWEYRVAEEHRPTFERLYAADGDWAKLFALSPAFLGTTLLRDRAVPSRYLTVDRWNDAESYDRFLETHKAEYTELDRRCEELTEYEMRIGAFEAL